jgi:hypothetical protein
MAARKTSWVIWGILGALAVGVLLMKLQKAPVVQGCPGSQVYCPGVGCLSGQDKCVPGSGGGASTVFSKERFEAGSFPSWPTALPPPIERKRCPGNTRTDGPCLMQPPGGM